MVSMFVFAVENHQQKARQDAIAKIETGVVLRIEIGQPLWDRATVVELRSPRGPKGASLGYAPLSVAPQLAGMLEADPSAKAVALRIEQCHGLRQLIVGVSPNNSIDPDSPATMAEIEKALADAPQKWVYVPTVYPVGIVGEASYQSAIRRARVGQPVRLTHEPSNPHDDRAISVQNLHGERIGYLPRDSWLHSVMLDEGKNIAGRIKSIEGRPMGVVLDVVVGTAADLDRATASNSLNVAGEVAEQADNAKGGAFSLSSSIILIGGLLALALLYQCVAA